MNKLLQHIIDAGDVDHKILPGLQKMQKAGIVMFKPAANEKAVYDNIPNPAVVRSQMAKDAAAKQLLAKRAADQAARDRHGYVYQAPAPRSMASKAWAIATNPMTALAYKVQGRDIPDNFELGKKNSLDIAANMVNPFAIVDAVASIPGNVARGEVLDAGLNALNLVPALSAARQAGKVAKAARPINKTVQAFGPNNSNKGLLNFLTTREGVDFDPGAILKDYKVGFSEGLLEGVPHALGTALRKTGIYPKARTIGRPFSEVFPTGANKAKVIQAQDQAFDNAVGFVNDYFYPVGSDELRPVLGDKIRTMFPNATGSPENFSKLSSNNPFNETEDILAKSTTWGSGREGLGLSDINYINRNRGTMGGFNSLGSSITLRNYGPYYKTPYDVARTAVHEAGHTSQKLGYVPSFKNPAIINTPLTWGSEIAKYDEGLNYYTSNPDTGLGRLFGKSMVTPGNPSFINKIINRGKRVDDAWESSPNELHSELIAEKYADYLRSFDKKNPNVGLQSGTLNKELIDQLANPSDDILKRILDRGNLDKHFRPETTLEDRLKLLRLLPAAAPIAAAGALGANEQRYGGENNMFKVFAQEGVEYKGPSIVDYLATKGYSGKKQFRKELADKYGIEGYDFSAAKNTELLNRLRESDELLRQYDQTMAPVPVERMMEMEQQARAARQAAAAQPNTQPVRRPAPVYNFSPEFQNMRIPEIKVNTSLQPKVIYDGKFSLTPKMVVPMPFGFNKTTPAPEVPNSKITDPVRNTPARPKLNLPQYNPFVRPEVRPELGPFISDRYNDVQEVDPPTEQGTPEFLFDSQKLFNSFNRPKQKPLLPVVLPAKKPVVKTEKYTKPEAEELSWYEEAATALKSFYDDFSERVNKSPLDFSKMTMSPSGFTPEGTQAMAKDLTIRAASLLSPEKGKLVDSYFKRQDLKNNDNLQETKTKFVIPEVGRPAITTGDTINIDNNRYVIPAMIDLNQTNWGVRNRDEYKDINTEAADITTFQSFENAKDYFAKNANDPNNSTYIGVDANGKVKVGNKADFLNSNYRITKTFGNKIVDFVDEADGSMKLKNSSSKASNKHLSPVVKVMGDDGKMTEGSINLLIPKGNRDTKSFGQITGGRVIFKTPKGEQFLVSGSAEDIRNAFKQIKGDNPYVEAVTLDNGSYAMGFRNKNQKITAQELKDYQGSNTTGSAFLYLQPGNYTRGTNAGVPKLQFKDVEMTTPNIRTKNDESFKKGHSLTNEQKAIILHHTGYSDTTGVSKGMSKAMQGVAKQFSQPGESSHVVIDFDGTRYNYARPDQVTFHAGKSMFNGRDNVNDFGIGIEFQGDTNKTRLTDKQINSFVEYAGPIIKKNNIPLSSIITHKQIRSDYMKVNPQDKEVLGKPDVNEIDYQRIINALKKKGYYEQGGPVVDPMGQWAHPGKITRIPGSDITMQGVPYPVYGVGSNGQEQMMYPGQEYNFGGASYVDEYPIMQGGGWSGGGLSRSNLAMMSALNKDIKDQKARDAQVTISQYTPKPGDQQRMNANKDAYRKEQGKFLNRLADNQHMQAAGKNLPGAAEFALDVMTAGEAGVALKAAKPLLKAAGKYLTQKTPLRYASKFNPYALTDNMLFNKEGVVNRQMFGDEAFENFKQYGPTTRPNVSQYDQMMEFIKAPKSDVISGSGEVFQVAKTMEDGAFKYPYFQEGNLWYTGQQRNNLANQLGTERIITTPKSDIWFAPAGEGTVMHGDDLSQGLINSYSKGRRVLIPGSEYAKPSKYSVFEPHWWKGYKQVQEEGGQISMMANGGYTVTRSNDRKGKTHKVTGPGGVVKYFGDSKLGQHPKDPERKAAFYARHKKNLAGNPFFRAFARKTWQSGGQTDSTLENILEVFDPTGLSSWDDVYRSANDPSSKWYDTAIEVAGALPLVGKLGKLAKAGVHLKKYKGLEKAAFNMIPKSTSLSNTLQGAALLGRGSDAVQAGVAAPKAPFFPSAPPAGVGQFGVYAGMPVFEKKKYGGTIKAGKQPLEKKHGIKVTYKK